MMALHVVVRVCATNTGEVGFGEQTVEHDLIGSYHSYCYRQTDSSDLRFSPLISPPLEQHHMALEGPPTVAVPKVSQLTLWSQCQTNGAFGARAPLGRDSAGVLYGLQCLLLRLFKQLRRMRPCVWIQRVCKKQKFETRESLPVRCPVVWGKRQKGPC